jgi:hypothetical protein
VLRNKLKTALKAVLLPTALVLGTGLTTGLVQSPSDAAEKADRADREKSSGGLSRAEFKQLRPILDLKNQPWATIPWKYSLTEARKLAAASQKPIFMVVNTGNALGCT